MVWTSEVSADPPGSSVILVATARELVIGRASIAPLVRGSPLSMPLPAERLSSHSFWGMSSPLLRALWSLLLVELALLPSLLRVVFRACRSLLGVRNGFSALQSSLWVELALLPSHRGSLMSIPLPYGRLSSLSFWGMSVPPSRACCR